MYLIESITQSSNEKITNETIEVLKSKLEGVRESSRRVAELSSRSAALVDEYALDILKVVTAVDSIPEHLPGSGVIKKELRRYLTDFCGVSKARVSKMLSVEAFTKKLKSQGSHAHDWYQSLPMSSRYILALMNEQGFSKAWAELSQWGTRTVTRAEFAELKNKHPQEVKKVSRETSVENSPTTKPTMSYEDQHLNTLINLDTLPQINTKDRAKLWWAASLQSADTVLAVIRQKMEVDSSFKEQLLDLIGRVTFTPIIKDPATDEFIINASTQAQGTDGIVCSPATEENASYPLITEDKA